MRLNNRIMTGGWIAVLIVGTALAGRAEQNMLQQTSEAFANLAEKAMPAVVSIKVEKTTRIGGAGRESVPFNDPFEFFGDDFMRRFFPGQGQVPRRAPRQREFKQQGAGSGFLISKDGYILSNAHVVGDADTISVRLNDGREFEAERIGTDPKSEVALIKIAGDNFPVLPLADSSAIRVGQWVVAIGNPFGLAETLTVGVISAKGRSNIGIADYEDFIQTDAAINPGNSGGPLLNTEGEVIGINTAIYSRSGGYMGIGFAVPINMAKFVKAQLIESGEVIRSYLGIYIQPITPELADAFGLDSTDGILVSTVTEGGGAEKGGLQAGDIILKLNGKKVRNIGVFRNTVAATPPGTEMSLTIFRDGDRQTLEVTTGAFPEVGEEIAATPELDEKVEKLGLTVETLTPELAGQFGYDAGDGVIVSQVAYGSAAAAAGIRPGDLIRSVNRTEVSTEAEFRKALDTGSDRVLLHVSNNRGSRFVVLNAE